MIEPQKIIREYMNDNIIIQEIKKSNYLPVIAGGMGQLLELLINPEEFNLELFIDLLKKHKNLEETLIKILNTGSKLNRKITDLREVVTYLGINNTKFIMIAYLTRLLIPNRKGRAKLFDSYKYWIHCVGTAVASMQIAKILNISDGNKLFTYGLIHDIGITILDACLPEKLTKISEKHMGGLHQIVAEKIVLNGLTHADIGKWICEEWGLPEEICDVVGYHHNPFLKENISIDVIIMHLADSISTNYYEGLLGNKIDFVYSEKTRLKLGLSKEIVQELADKLPEEVKKIAPLVESLF